MATIKMTTNKNGTKIHAPEFRRPYYSASDGLIGLESKVKELPLADVELAKQVKKVQDEFKKLTQLLDKKYLWD